MSALTETGTGTPAPVPVIPETIREITGELTFSRRRAAAFARPRTSKLTPAQAAGIRYENKVHRALGLLAKNLTKTVPSSLISYTKNPWFEFSDSLGTGICSPDGILELGGVVIVIEVKNTWTPLAERKLTKLYLPVVYKALNPRIVRSLVICKNLVPGAPHPIPSIARGTELSINSSPVYHWLGTGPLIW